MIYIKNENKKYNYQLTEIERLIKKQYNKKVDFKSLDMYEEEIPYMSNLNEEEKKNFRSLYKFSNIKIIGRS